MICWCHEEANTPALRILIGKLRRKSVPKRERASGVIVVCRSLIIMQDVV